MTTVKSRVPMRTGSVPRLACVYPYAPFSQQRRKERKVFACFR